jgi:hypothetical protein
MSRTKDNSGRMPGLQCGDFPMVCDNCGYVTGDMGRADLHMKQNKHRMRKTRIVWSLEGWCFELKPEMNLDLSRGNTSLEMTRYPWGLEGTEAKDNEVEIPKEKRVIVTVMVVGV